MDPRRNGEYFETKKSRAEKTILLRRKFDFYVLNKIRKTADAVRLLVAKFKFARTLKWVPTRPLWGTSVGTRLVIGTGGSEEPS